MAAALAARWQPILEALGVARPGEIGWIHGANTRAALAGGLSDPQVNFIEGDISPVGGEIIMAHPPVTESDLTFEAWLDMTIAAGKGAKLDFKSPEALAHCLAYASRHALGKIPLCLSADILPGPGGGPPRFKAAEFLRMCREYLPRAILSLGWTVGETATGYTKEMIATMLDLLVDVDAAVTLCFHANLLPSAWPQLSGILDETDYTLTVWGRIHDPSVLTWLRTHTSPDRCFYDVQTEDRSQIHLMSL